MNFTKRAKRFIHFKRTLFQSKKSIFHQHLAILANFIFLRFPTGQKFFPRFTQFFLCFIIEFNKTFELFHFILHHFPFLFEANFPNKTLS